MTGTTPTQDDCLQTAYEQLRGAVFDEGVTAGGFGLAVFLREGMAAWMSCYRPTKPVTGTRGPWQPRASPPDSSEMVSLWVNMITAKVEERFA